MSSFPTQLQSFLAKPNERAPLSPTNQESNSGYELHVQQQVEQLGPTPSLLQVTAVLLAQSSKAEHEAKKARQELSKNLVETVKVVKTHHTDIEKLKTDMSLAEVAFGEMKGNQSELSTKMNELETMVNKTYTITCENKQRSSKGNFILSGEHIPRFRPNEDILAIVLDLVFRKYEIEIYPQEFKVIHRLQGGRILFALHNRLPGWSFERLIRAMNSNPHAGLKVYVSIQLFEPFSELFYIARRLKYHQIISYYRLDENGYTFIALNEQSKAFKFTSLDQLKLLQIQVPQGVINELYERRDKIAESEKHSAEENLRKALEPRPAIAPKRSDIRPDNQPRFSFSAQSNSQPQRPTQSYSFAQIPPSGETTPSTFRGPPPTYRAPSTYSAPRPPTPYPNITPRVAAPQSHAIPRPRPPTQLSTQSTAMPPVTSPVFNFRPPSSETPKQTVRELQHGYMSQIGHIAAQNPTNHNWNAQ